MSESVILCEGYHDRAFWSGWLAWLGCTDPGIQAGKTGRVPVVDPWGVEVKGRGQHAFLSPGGKFIRVIPCNGKSNVRRQARERLADRMDKNLERLVINVDSDAAVAPGEEPDAALTTASLETLLREFGQPAVTADGDFAIDDGATLASLVAWRTPDDAMSSLPDRQTLERVACAAIVAVHPGRGGAVDQWLASRPDAPGAGPKEFAWSYMAGWYAERGCEGFYRAVWEDPAVAAELEGRLRKAGAWRVAEALAQ
jgi:hypothetical protein